jgi:hypothetical protein
MQSIVMLGTGGADVRIRGSACLTPARARAVPMLELMRVTP